MSRDATAARPAGALLRPTPPITLAFPRRAGARAFSGARHSLLARHRPLQHMLLAGFISGLGDRLHQVALAALVLALSGSLVQAGLVFLVSTLPYVLFGLVAGVLVDRWERRRTLVRADLVRAILVLAIPFAAPINLSLVYLLLFAVACASIVFGPAQQALVPDLVDEGELSDANKLFQTVRFTTDLVGYPVAGVLVTWLVASLGPLGGTRFAFALDALSYVISAAFLVQLPEVRRAERAAAGVVAGLRTQVAEGLRFLGRHAQLRANTLLVAFGALLLGSMHTLWVGFAWRVSHTDAWGYGVTETLYAAGVLAGLWALRRAERRLNAGRLVLLGFALMGLSALGVGLTDRLALAALLATLGGAGNMFFLVPSITLVQRRTPSALRGRVLSVRLSLTYTAFAASNGLAGVLSEQVGVGPLLVVLGAAMVALALGAHLVPSAREAR